MSWTSYESHPWEGIDSNKRNWYDPMLRQYYLRNAIYSRLATPQVNFAAMGTEKITITRLIPPHANNDSLTTRQMWMNSSYIDSEAREVTFAHYGGKLAYHKYDNMVTYWQQDGVRGLERIINNALGGMMVGVMDKLARNAFLSNSFAMYGNGTASSFNGITANDKITTTLIDDIHLGLKERDVPMFQGLDGRLGNIFCITSPGVVRDLRYEDTASGANSFTEAHKYAQPMNMINGEVGSYHNTRFIETNNAILYNSGPITVQPTIAAAAAVGDGSPDPATTTVDGAYRVGQAGAQATHYLTLSAVTSLAVGDIVTIHKTRTNAFGVTNGVDHREGTLHYRRIVSIDAGNSRIVLDKPLMEPFATDLGGGVYGYVTKGRHIHTALFVGGLDGVVMGVAQPPQIYDPNQLGIVDDTKSMYRFSWDGYFGFNLFEPTVFEVAFLAGSNRIKGPRINT